MKAVIKITETNEKDYQGRAMVDVEIVYFSDDETMEEFTNIVPWYINTINKLTKTEIKSKIEL